VGIAVISFLLIRLVPGVFVSVMMGQDFGERSSKPRCAACSDSIDRSSSTSSTGSRRGGVTKAPMLVAGPPLARAAPDGHRRLAAVPMLAAIAPV
jgi:hypothetical protein